MAVVSALDAVGAVGANEATRGVTGAVHAAGFSQNTSFADLMTAGLRSVEAKTAKADALIQSFALGDPVPVHQVALAIEQARLSVEMALQVRSKLVDTYHDFLNMQL